jgi:outer membrane receptor protein involved in Fe transport
MMIFAGETGKVMGTVTDKANGNLLPGVNVVLEGTSMGAATDEDGDFYILNVPPGLYNVKLSYIGYAVITIENIRVTRDLTTNLYIVELSSEAIAGQEITVIADKPLIEINATNEVRVIRSEDIKNLPIRGVANIVALQTSVVQDGGNLHVRGGRAEEVGFYVDGVNVSDPFSLTRTGSIPNISIEEVSFQAGGFGAEYGSANAGIVNTSTKTGRDRLQFTGESLSDIGATAPSTDRNKLYSYGNKLVSGSLGGPIPVLNFIRYYGALEYTQQDDSPTAGLFPLYNTDKLNPLNGLPNNGEDFTDQNGNTIWDTGEPWTDMTGEGYTDGEYDAPSYLKIDTDDISYVYGPRANNWYNRLSANWNLLFDLNNFLPFAWQFKLGGTYFDSQSSNYSHTRTLFNYYNDGDGLTNRFNQSFNTISTLYGRLTGEVPGVDKMFFSLQFDNFSSKASSYDPVYKKGFDNFVYEDGTVSSTELPYMMNGKVEDYSNPTWMYLDAAGNTVTRSEVDWDPTLTFVGMDYDTTFVNPLWKGVNSQPSSMEQIANYGVAGQSSTWYSKSAKERNTMKGSILWQVGDHELKFGGHYEKANIRSYSVSGGRIARYFDSNAPYSATQDIWTWDAEWNDGAGALVVGPDGIDDFRQDPGDTYKAEGNDANYDDYFDNQIFQAYKGAYANNIGYDITGRYDMNSGINKARTPIIMAYYFQDKFELSDLIMNLGLRYDHVDPANKVFNPLTGGNQNIIITDAGTLAETVYYNDLDGNGKGDPFEYQYSEPTDDDATGLIHQVDVKPSTQISPRIGLAFPVTDKTVFHASYGKYLMPVKFDYLYISYARFLSNIEQGNYTRSPNPELMPTKTTDYEIGFKQLVTNDISIDITMFYNEKSDYLQIRNVAARPTGYALYVNGDYATNKGLNFSLNTRRIANTRVSANYTLSWAGGTGSNANTGYRISWLGGNDPTFTSPMTFDQRHTGSLSIDYRTGARSIVPLFGANILMRFGSGLRYTPSKPRTAVFGGQLSDQPIAGLNSGVMPGTFNIDLRLDKTFVISGVSLGLFCVVKNVLNSQNVSAVYNYSGLPDNDGYLTTQAGQNWLNDWAIGGPEAGQDLYTSRITSPSRWGNPRQVQIGLRVDL